MANIQKYTKKALAELREKGRQDLYFFQKGLLLDRDLVPHLHGNLCRFMQSLRPGDMAMLCGFRGCLKSSTLRAWLWWAGLYQMYVPDFSSFYVEQKYENAEYHHELFQAKFRYGPQAAMLQDMFQDRLPPELDGWTKKRTLLRQTDSNSEAFVTVASIEGRMEGGHRWAIVFDDLEGADADESDVPSREAQKFVFERAIPLMVSPERAFLVGAGTPHGNDPLVFRIRETPGWKKWWVSWTNNEGKSRWPERFSDEWVDQMRKQAERNPAVKRMIDSQYRLLPPRSGLGYFDMDAVNANVWERKFVPVRDAKKAVIVYPKAELTKMPNGEMEWVTHPAQVGYDALRYSMHIDPAHKEKDERMSERARGFSKWAIITVGTSPNWHFFTVDVWIREGATYDEAMTEIFRQYRMWVPDQVTFDPIGAQIWLRHQVRILEKSKYRHMRSLPSFWNPVRRRIPLLSSRMVEADKANVPKEEHILASLETHHKMGWLHLGKYQEDLIEEHERFGRYEDTFDGLDALAQGPAVWTPKLSPEAKKELQRRIAMQQIIAPADRFTGYESPFARRI